MKDQYVGDIGDFGKYSLLRAFINAGIKVGINWYLTDNDGSNDGKFTEYLKKDEFRRYDPTVFDALKEIAFNSTKSVEDVQKSGMLGNSVFYSEFLHPQGGSSDRQKARKQWFEKSIGVLRDVELVFMDPDNGLMEKGDASKTGAEKYVLPDEVGEYYKSGHNVVYYCHRADAN